MTQTDLEGDDLGRAVVRSLRRIRTQEETRALELARLHARQSKLRASKPQQDPGGMFAPRQISLLGD